MDSLNDGIYRTCKLCGSDRLKLLYMSRRSSLPIVQCVACGLVFVGKIFSSEEQIAFYNNRNNYRIYAEAERSVPEVKARHLEWLVEIQRQFGPLDGFVNASERKPRVLDIGCGVGDFLSLAEGQGFEAYGLEVSTPAAQLAAEWHGIQVEVREVKDDPRGGFFDVVTVIGVLEHVLYPKDMLQHVHRLLASGGILFIYTPVWGIYDALTSFLARASGGRFTKPIDRRINQAHLQIFSRLTLINLLRQLGMETLTCEVVCEYNLPVKHYLQSLGITQTQIQSIAAKSAKALIDRKLFFRNNMRVIARKV